MIRFIVLVYAVTSVCGYINQIQEDDSYYQVTPPPPLSPSSSPPPSPSSFPPPSSSSSPPPPISSSPPPPPSPSPAASPVPEPPVPEPVAETFDFQRSAVLQSPEQPYEIQECLCPDVAPTFEFPCEYEVAVGNCNSPANTRLMINNQLVYCLCSCDLCTDPESLPAIIEPQSQIMIAINGSGYNSVSFGMVQSGGVGA